jgi:hypothetical protein
MEPLSSHKGPPDKPNKPEDIFIKKNFYSKKQKKFYLFAVENANSDDKFVSLSNLRDNLEKKKAFNDGIWNNFIKADNFDLTQMTDVGIQLDHTLKMPEIEKIITRKSL